MNGFFRTVVLIGMTALAACATESKAPDIDVRIMHAADWGSIPANVPPVSRHAINRITLHHQGETFVPGRDVKQYLRNLQSWSRNTRGWVDIPYHYVIDLDGNIYEGRAVEYSGDTNTEYDPTGHALIEVLGNYENIEPGAAQLDAIVKLMAMLARKYRVPVEEIRGHKDYSNNTVCPGKNLYRYLANGELQRRVREELAGSGAR